jgi:hypothetical protein
MFGLRWTAVTNLLSDTTGRSRAKLDHRVNGCSVGVDNFHNNSVFVVCPLALRTGFEEYQIHPFIGIPWHCSG